MATRHRIVLVGLGRVGFRTYDRLRSLGERIVVVERDADNPFLDVVREHGEPLLVGDGRRDQLLQDAGIESAKSIIVATDDDLANLELALDARRFHPGIRVILRMFDQGMADKIGEGFDIHLTMSVSAISAPNFNMAAVDPKIVSSFVMDDRLIVMLRSIAHEGGPLCHKTIGDIQAELGFGVARVTSAGGETKLFPPSGTRLGPGDELLVQRPYDELITLKQREVNLAVGPRT